MTAQSPDGFAFMYEVTEDFQGLKPHTYSMTLPSAVDHVHAASLRVSRDGGPDSLDFKFRADLFVRVGAVVVAAGHVEVSMQRLLILLTGKSGHLSEVRDMWNQLQRDLRVEAAKNPAEARNKRLLRVLDWADEQRLSVRRNDVVHAAWSLYDPPGVRGSRFRPSRDGETLLWSLEDLDRLAELIFQFNARLDDLAGEDWGRAILPKRSAPPPTRPT